MLVVQTPLGKELYAYALGLFLGDGHLARHGRTARLVISCDAGYPDLIEEARLTVENINPDARVAVRPREDCACVEIVSYGLRWLDLFPQHGPGPKHLRPIELEAWQREVTLRHPEAFLRGLIHSDGCRTTNRFRTTLPTGRVAEYSYARYFFSNSSSDIRRLFCEACDQIGVEWTQSNPRNISISRRTSVALLDEFVGPKR